MAVLDLSRRYETVTTRLLWVIHYQCRGKGEWSEVKTINVH